MLQLKRIDNGNLIPALIEMGFDVIESQSTEYGTTSIRMFSPSRGRTMEIRTGMYSNTLEFFAEAMTEPEATLPEISK